MKFKNNLIAFRVGVIYLIVGGLWIFLSDKLLLLVFNDVDVISHFQTYKGWFFVFASATLIFFLVKRESKTIHDKQKLKEEANTNKAFYETIIEGVQDGIWVTDCNDIIYYVNDPMEHISGVSNELFIGNNVLKDFQPETTFDFNKFYKKAKRLLKPVWYEVKVITPVRRLSYQNGWLIPIKKDGVFNGMICTVRDVTERSIAEINLKESRERYRKVSSISSDYAYSILVDKQGNFQYEWTFGSYEKTTGYGYVDLNKMGGLAALIHPEDIHVANDHYNKLLKRQASTSNLRIITKNGETKWLHDNGIPEWDNEENRVIRIIGSATDITSQKETLLALQKSEENLKEAQKLGKIGNWEFDPVSKKVNGSHEAAAIFEVSHPVDLASKEILAFLHPDDKERYIETTSIWIEQKNLSPIEYRVIVNHKLKYIFETVKAIKNSEGVVVRLFGTIQDVTQQKEGEQQLLNAKLRAEKSEKSYLDLFQNMRTAFAYHRIVTDKRGKPIDYIFLEVNPEFERLTGLRKEQLINKRVKEVMPNTEDFWIESYGKVALTGEPLNFSHFARELNSHFEVSAYSPMPNHFAVTFNNINDRVAAELAISEYQHKLKELNRELFYTEEKGKRALAVALHDHFSQLLALSKMKLSEFKITDDPVQKEQHLNDAIKYINDALTETRAMTYELSPPILYELGLLHAMDWYIETIQKKHALKFNFFKKLNEIVFSEDIQIIIYRIFTELVTNIIKHAKATSVLLIIEEVNNLFYLRVSDDGVGFNPEDKSLTTKSFGLFSIKERIEQLQGDVQIVSAPNKGTVVDISIPLK